MKQSSRVYRDSAMERADSIFVDDVQRTEEIKEQSSESFCTDEESEDTEEIIKEYSEEEQEE